MSVGLQAAGTRDRALMLLGSGQPPGVVATALGVDHSRIAQLLAEPEFAQAVAELRFKNLQNHALRDKKWDSIEDELLEKLRDVLDYIVKPGELLRALATVNAAKRRGMVDPTTGGAFSATVKLQLPGVIKARFQVDGTGVIISVGDRALSTMSPNVLMKEVFSESSESSESREQTSGSRLPAITASTNRGDDAIEGSSNAASPRHVAEISEGDSVSTGTGGKHGDFSAALVLEMERFGL